jgi:hypothetical protein
MATIAGGISQAFPVASVSVALRPPPDPGFGVFGKRLARCRWLGGGLGAGSYSGFSGGHVNPFVRM